METTLPPLPLPIVDGRKDFIETYKKELIAIGILSGFLVLIVLYLVYHRFTTPTPPLTPQIKKQQTVVVSPAPPLTPQVKKQQTVVVSPAPPLTPQIKKQQTVVVSPAPPLTPALPIPQVKKQQQALQVKKQQQKFPHLKSVNNKMIRRNLPAINNPISTGFSNQFHKK